MSTDSYVIHSVTKAMFDLSNTLVCSKSKSEFKHEKIVIKDSTKDEVNIKLGYKGAYYITRI